MKLLFIYINPTGRTAIPPNISMLIGHLKSRRDYDVEVFDTSFYSFEFDKPIVESTWTTGYFRAVKNPISLPDKKSDMYEDLSEQVREFDPDLVAVSAYSNQFGIVKSILAYLKEHFPAIPNLVGGAHPSFVPEEVIADEVVDMICVGEGENVLVSVCDAIKDGKEFDEIGGLWFKRDGAVFRSEVCRPIDLDEIGEPDWSIFDPVHVLQPFHGRYVRMGMVEYGRGCPNRCTYCANSKYLKIYSDYKSSYFRHRNPSRFIDWLKGRKEAYDLELIYFQDGTFLTMTDEQLHELADLYERHIDLPCIILTTVNSISDERLECLRRMKCVFINLGIEEGSGEFREKMLKRYMSNEKIESTFQRIREFGIYTAAYNVIGFPYETRENIFETIDLNRRCSPDSVYTQIFYPLDGSELKELCLTEGYFDPAVETDHNRILDCGTVSLLENLPVSREVIHGLLRTFYLYVRCPKWARPLVRFLERDTFFSRRAIGLLTRYYYDKHGPDFSNPGSLSSARLGQV